MQAIAGPGEGAGGKESGDKDEAADTRVCQPQARLKYSLQPLHINITLNREVEGLAQGHTAHHPQGVWFLQNRTESLLPCGCPGGPQCRGQWIGLAHRCPRDQSGSPGEQKQNWDSPPADPSQGCTKDKAGVSPGLPCCWDCKCRDQCLPDRGAWFVAATDAKT